MKTKEFLPFYLSDLDAVARHFEEKAAEGLMLKSFSNTCEYEPCEPIKLRFNAVLCPVNGSDNVKINDDSRDFIGLCEEAGWRFVDHRGSVYVFCCRGGEIPDIMTDGMERVTAVENAEKRDLLTTFLVGMLAGIQILIYAQRAFYPGEDRVGNICMAAFFAVELILLVFVVILKRRNGRRWREKAIKAIEAGEPIPPSDGKVLIKRRVTAVLCMIVLAAAVLALLASAFISSSPEGRSFLAAMLTAAIPLAFIPRLFRKKRSPAAKTFIIIGLVLGYLLLTFILVLIFGAAFGAFQ